MNINYLVFDTTSGEQRLRGTCPADELELIPLTAGEIIAEEPSSFSLYGWRYVDGEVICNLPPVLTLADKKVIKWDEIKLIRDRTANGVAITPLGPVDCDESSRVNISGAVSGALIAQAANAPYMVEWTMADNSTVAHDATAMIAMGVAVLQHVAACYDRGRELRDQINAAVDETGLEAIEWDASI